MAPKAVGGMKQCVKCNRVKRVGLYHKDRTSQDGYTSWCKACRNRYLDTGRAKANSNLKTRFNITVDEYDALYEKQGNKCAICGRRYSGKRHAVDHDHAIEPEYGGPDIRRSIRGILCRPCNRILGHWRDDPKVAARALDYLLNPKYPFDMKGKADDQR